MQFILIAVTQEQFHLLCLALVALLIKPLPVYTFFIDFEPIAVLDRFVGKDRLKITGLLFRPPVETETFHPYAFAGLHAFGGIDDKPFEEIECFDQIRFPAGIGPVDDRTLQQREVRTFKLKTISSDRVCFSFSAEAAKDKVAGSLNERKFSTVN